MTLSGHRAERPGLKAQLQRLAQWWKGLRVARALARYGVGNGAQLSGGIALSGLLSVAAALTVALTMLTSTLKKNAEFRDTFFAQIDEVLPGVIDTGSGGMVTPDQLVLNTGWSLAAVIAALVLLSSATTVMSALRNGLRAMFGLHRRAENFIIGKLRDLLGFLALAISVLLTSVLTIGTRVAVDWVDEQIGDLSGVPGSEWGLQALTFGLSFLVDATVFALLFRFLAGARVPWPQLWRGSLVGAVGTGALRLLGTTVVTGVSDKPLLASAAAVATLLLWLNLAARITLLVAAWTADPPPAPKPRKSDLDNAEHTPNYVTMSDPKTLEWDYGTYSGLIVPGQDDADAEASPA